MLETKTTLRGPLLTGKAPSVIRAFTDTAKEAVADEGVNDVVHNLGMVLQHPTGRYQSRIHTERARSDRVITDGGIIYGPWLEGTSRRNQSTRFKGYRTFRRTAQQLQAKAHGIAQSRLGPFLARLR